MWIIVRIITLCLTRSLLLPSSFDTSASDRGVLGGGGSADEGQDGARHFRFLPPLLRSPTAVIRTAATVEEQNPGLELAGTHRAAFGHWSSGMRGEDVQPEQHDACDEDIPFEVIGGW